MALIKCECGQDISDQATKCPHCGKEKSSAKTEVKTGKGIKLLWLSIGGIIGGIVIVVLVIGVFVLLLNWQTIFKAIVPPNPVVVSYKAQDTSSLFDYKIRVYATIRNDGGNGDVVMKVTVTEGEKSWSKTKKEYFDSKQTKTMDIGFTEATLFGKTRYYVEAYAFGK